MELDKNTILQVLGSLMKKPSILAEVDKYILTPQDFPSSFEKYIFAAISNLYYNGAEKINVVDIDNYLITHETAYKHFNENNGIDYLNDAEDLSSLENFDYYYNKLKKINVLKDLKLMGFNVSKIYPETLLDEDAESKKEKFENMSVSEIFNSIKKDLATIEDKYETKVTTRTQKANSGIQELLKDLKASPEVGAGLQGDIFNTITRGARKGKFYLQSSPTGGGKTRQMIGNACYLAYPIYYDSNKEKWINKGSCEKILYVGTEQRADEIQTMILSYLSGINEEKILYGTYTEAEEDILNKAIKVMEMYSDNFIITQIPDPSIQQVKTIVRKYCLIDNIEYVFYDYIFSSPSLLGEMRGINIREDVLLLLLSSALKDLAVELDIFMMSATQISGDLENVKGIRDQKLLRGSKAIADKIDMGMISTKIYPEEYRTLDAAIKATGIVPNIVSDIYKLRRGRYNNVRIWSYMDFGTCRKKDLFITDADFKKIQDFKQIEILFTDNIREIDKNLALLNTGEVTDDVQEEIQFPQEQELKQIKEIEKKESKTIKDIVPVKSEIFGNLL